MMEYTINAEVELRYELDAKFLSEYKATMSTASNAREFMLALSEKVITKSEVSNIFSIDLIPADRKTESTLPETRNRKLRSCYTGISVSQSLIPSFFLITTGFRLFTSYFAHSCTY